MLEANEGTREIADEINTRLALNPGGARRIGNFGFIELEDTWGDETTILNTARVSTSNRRLNRVEDLTDKDRTLLRHLLSENHGTPFETVYFRYRFIAPIFVLRQWVKHRISTWNEFSMRYRKPISAFYIPDPEARTIDGFKVMTEDQVSRYTDLLETMNRFYEEEYEKVCERIDDARKQGTLPEKTGGRDPYRARARELLRSAMPVANYSDVYWTVNFRSLMNFFNLRMKETAQYEIREYARAAYVLFGDAFPLLKELMEEIGKTPDQPVSR
jgi:thymidylate synthase (FAD)